MSSGDVFQGSISGFPELSVDYFCGNRLSSCSHFFLSHCHTDHIKGLDSREFKVLSQTCNVKIYCTATTGSLVTHRSKLTYLEPLFVFLEVEEPYTIPVSDTQTIDVYLLDANHCPGSVMFLFSKQGEECALYTGDFRVSENSESIYNFLSQKHINSLYLDTTFFCPKIPAFRKFPSRKESEGAAMRFVEREKERNPTLSVHIDVTPGWENIFISLAEHFDCDIQTTEELLAEYAGIHQIVFYLTESPSWIHVNKTNNNCLLCEEKTVKLRPSVQWKLHNNTLDSSTMVAPKSGKGNENVWYVTHSMHSSYSECVNFIGNVAADKVYPIATPPRSSNAEIISLCKKYWKTASTITPSDISSLSKSRIYNNDNSSRSINRINSIGLNGKERVDCHEEISEHQSISSESDDCLPIITFYSANKNNVEPFSQSNDDKFASATNGVLMQMACAENKTPLNAENSSDNNELIENAATESGRCVVASRRKTKRRKFANKRHKQQIDESSDSEYGGRINPGQLQNKCVPRARNTKKCTIFCSSESESTNDEEKSNCPSHKMRKRIIFPQDINLQSFDRRQTLNILNSSESQDETVDTSVKYHKCPQIRHNDPEDNKSSKNSKLQNTECQTSQRDERSSLSPVELSIVNNSACQNENNSEKFQKWEFFDSSGSESDEKVLPENIIPSTGVIKYELTENKEIINSNRQDASKKSYAGDIIKDMLLSSDSDRDLAPATQIITNSRIDAMSNISTLPPDTNSLFANKLIDDLFCSD